MQIGIVGLGRMGGNMAARWRDRGHEVLGYSRTSPDRDADSLEALVAQARRTPRGVADAPLGRPDPPGPAAARGTAVPRRRDRRGRQLPLQRRHRARPDARRVRYRLRRLRGQRRRLGPGERLRRDVRRRDEHVERVWPLLESLAPDRDGLCHAGPVGAGHYAKMVHNGIEYGMMQALAEGYELLEASEYVPDVPKVLASWRHGTVVRSWLLDLLVRALDEDPGLATLSGRVDDSGEGRWTVEEAVRLSVSAPAMTAALFARFASRKPDADQLKALAAMRRQFGGHAVHATAGRAAQG